MLVPSKIVAPVTAKPMESVKAKTIHVVTVLDDSPVKTKISETSPNK